jgi:hypothetical protein
VVPSGSPSVVQRVLYNILSLPVGELQHLS